MAFWKTDTKKLKKEADELEKEIRDLSAKVWALIGRDIRDPRIPELKAKIAKKTKEHLKLLKKAGA